MKDTIVKGGTGILIGALGMWIFIAFFMDKGQTTEGTKVAGLGEKKTIECDKVQVHRPKAKRKAKLPKELVKSPTVYLTDARRILADGHDHLVSAVLDSKDGNITIYDHRVPLPMIGRKRRITMGIDYGITDEGSGWRATGEYDLLQIKALQIGFRGHATHSGAYFAGAGIKYSW